MNKKAVGYCRVSSKEQEETGYSLPAQEKLVREYAEKMGFELIKVFSISESASGKVQRKTFKEMMYFVKLHKIPVIIVETTDRLTRNFKECIEIDDWINSNEENEVHLVKEGTILHKNANSNDWFMWRVKVSTAEYYVKRLSENVKKGQKEKLEEGWLPYRKFGYKTIGDKGKKIHILDTERAVYVKEIFELYSTGKYSIVQLADVMYERGLRSINGGKVSPSIIHRILTDPFYCGELWWNGKFYGIGNHEPIISKELFEKVQSILKRTRPPLYKKHNPPCKNTYCRECGSKFSWYAKKDHWYSRCANYKNCLQNKKPIKFEYLDKRVAEEFDGLSIPDDILELVKKALMDSHKEEIETRKILERDLKIKIEKIKSKLDILYQDRLEGLIDLEKYKAKKEELEKEMLLLQERLKDLEKTNLDYYDLGVNLLELCKKAKILYENATFQEKQDLIHLAFQKILIRDKAISFEYSPWFAILKKHSGLIKEICELEKDKILQGETANFEKIHSEMLRGQDSNLRHRGYTYP
jgi:DNA invertase Pin-like site-specific DNA recombinase